MQSACTISSSVRANYLGTRTYNHWRKLSVKPCKRYISVTDEVKINEQYKSKRQDPSTYLPNLNVVRHQNGFSNIWYVVLKIGTR